ncbi:50S ribosomal protein L11 methyltransferase [Escherichia coli]
MKADVVVADILAGPLRELAPLISVLPVQAVCWPFRYSGKPGRAFVKLMPIAFALDPVVEKEEWCRITGRTLTFASP